MWQPLTNAKIHIEYSCPPAVMICTYCFIAAFRSYTITHHYGKIYSPLVIRQFIQKFPAQPLTSLITCKEQSPPPHRKPALYFAESFLQLEISPLQYYQICKKLSCPLCNRSQVKSGHPFHSSICICCMPLAMINLLWRTLADTVNLLQDELG